MKKIFVLLCVAALTLLLAAVSAEDVLAETSWTTQLTAHCVTVEEGRELMRGRTLFHRQINEKSLAFYLQKKGGTVEEYIEYCVQQVLPFTEEEEKRVQDTMLWIQQLLETHGLQLPDPGTVSFVKTTGKDSSGAVGYTSEGAIFLAADYYDAANTPEDQFHLIVLHELSHCLSRLFPEYRQALYSLIHFTVLDHEIEIPEAVFSQIIANPDVEHHNSYSTFTIGGEKKDCYLVFLTDTVFEKEGDSFLLGMHPGIVPIGSTDIYREEEVEDFWDVIGRNTTYCVDPEELMANNFAFALVRLEEGFESFRNPEIMEGVIDYLKQERIPGK